MKAIVLAAGYATRLYPLTLTQPKPLLHVGGKPMIDWVLDNLAPIPGIDRVIIVANAKFAAQFECWAAGRRAGKLGAGITIINDGSTDDTNKLGAIGDLQLAIDREQVEDDIIVVAGDNLFSQSLEAFGTFCRGRAAPVVALYDVGDLEEIKKYNAISVDDSGCITFFEEKPKHPKSTRTAIALYYYPRSALAMIRQYILEANNPDQPGLLVQWLYPRTRFYTWNVPGIWFDIGSKQNLEEADRIFRGLRGS